MEIDIPGIILKNKLIPIDEVEKYLTEFLNDAETPEWEARIFRFILEFLNDDTTITQQTSGTTGKPKTLTLTKSALIASAKITLETLNIPRSGTAFLCLPIDYIAGKMLVVRALVGQMNLFYSEPSSMPELEGIGKIDLCSMVPMQAYNIFSDYDMLHAMGTLLVGGSEIRPELEEMLQSLKEPAYETFGMAETCSQVGIRRINGEEKDTKFKILKGFDISVDERSCMVVNADFLGEEIVTNDIIELIEGGYFIWHGRKDNLINSGGKKVHPETIESLIMARVGHPVAVCGVDDEKLGQRIVLAVEKQYCSDTKDLENLVKEVLMSHQQPKEFLLLDKIPLNNAFKIDRISLKKEIDKLITF